jgi:glycogen debranching enzyme
VGEVIRIDDHFYILAGSSLVNERTRVLKQDETFAVFNQSGDIRPIGLREQGIYHEGTRHLSCLDLRINKSLPMFLSSTVRGSNEVLTVDLASPDFVAEDEVVVPRGTLHLSRSKFLWEHSCYERLEITNYSRRDVEVDLMIEFGADFADIFEIRGSRRSRRGTQRQPRIDKDSVLFSYEGLDNVLRSTTLRFSPAPRSITKSAAEFRVRLAPAQQQSLFWTIACANNSSPPQVLTYTDARSATKQSLRNIEAAECLISSSNESFNQWIERSLLDLRMMTTHTRYGLYPYAGVPWFSTVFGRDGIITAMEMLWVNPDIARGVLSFLSATQAQTVDTKKEAEPGKILHEMRKGEMATLGEIPFGCYYGTSDATPLFVMLAGAYWEHTGDNEFIDAIWPNIERALAWIDQYGDADGDGFVEYARKSSKGLVQQGWKDSQDSVFHSDGTSAEPPIALCEIQSYVYTAKRNAARMARARGLAQRAEMLENEARDLQDRFERAFWCDDIGSYALALDGAKHPCRIRTSNAGHCLFSGIASPKHAARVAETLMSNSSFSGWGVRTLDASEVRYNPMSYHNGSIWPHDNAMISSGLAQYGFHEFAGRLLSAFFDVSLETDLHRIPELFCGFPRRLHQPPTPYPVACSPQSWAAGSVFMLLQASLGMSVDGLEGRVYFRHPALPSFLQELRISNLRVGRGTVDVLLRRYPESVGINVTRRSGSVEVHTIM